MNFGPQATEDESFAMMDKALELGIQFWDTADVYGHKAGQGYTEQIIGKYFAARPGVRERVVLATKVFGDMNLEGKSDPNLVRGLSARKIIQRCEASLKRMGTEWIDLYQMHHVDRNVPVSELLEAFDILKRQGKIVYVGSSNFAGWDIAAFNMAALGRKRIGLISEQCHYHLDNRMVELEVVPACRHFGVGLIPWSPLGGGLLGGALKKAEKGRRANANFEKRVAEKRPKLEKYEALCAEMGEEPGVVALAWLLMNPVVTAPIIGPRTMEQLTSAAKAMEKPLSEEVMKKLDEIFPGPGEGPKAWSW